MSSSIDNLRNNVSDNDTQLVNSILEDLKHKNTQPVAPNTDEITPEQQNELYMKQQDELEQQQRAMHQDMVNRQELQRNQVISESSGNDFLDAIKLESKSILCVISLGFLMNQDIISDLFASTDSSIFINTETKALTVQSNFIKAIIMGILFYVIKTYLL